jgi:hypothetical protein
LAVVARVVSDAWAAAAAGVGVYEKRVDDDWGWGSEHADMRHYHWSLRICAMSMLLTSFRLII